MTFVSVFLASFVIINRLKLAFLVPKNPLELSRGYRIAEVTGLPFFVKRDLMSTFKWLLYVNCSKSH